MTRRRHSITTQQGVVLRHVWSNPTWRRDSNQMASEEPGAVQIGTQPARELVLAEGAETRPYLAPSSPAIHRSSAAPPTSFRWSFLSQLFETNAAGRQIDRSCARRWRARAIYVAVRLRPDTFGAARADATPLFSGQAVSCSRRSPKIQCSRQAAGNDAIASPAIAKNPPVPNLM
jgi:hypothetical protein